MLVTKLCLPWRLTPFFNPPLPDVSDKAVFALAAEEADVLLPNLQLLARFLPPHHRLELLLVSTTTLSRFLLLQFLNIFFFSQLSLSEKLKGIWKQKWFSAKVITFLNFPCLKSWKAYDNVNDIQQKIIFLNVSFWKHEASGMLILSPLDQVIQPSITL